MANHPDLERRPISLRGMQEVSIDPMNDSLHPFRILDPSRRSAEYAGECALTVMAKAPLPGKVKTRLSPPLTPEQASALNACFLRDTVASIRDATLENPANLVISYTPEGEEAAFCDILDEGTLMLPQRGDGFGERLLATAQDLFACGFSAICLIDSDSPTVPTSEYTAAVKALLRPGDRVVLGPSQDGGYYLIGMQQPVARLFEEIRWSTEAVSAQTRERATEVGIPVDELQRWYDVDDAESLGHLYAELFTQKSRVKHGYPAPRTREYLSTLPDLPFSISPEVETAQ
jgi:rSAM/selenodomain-associated transferase 1